MDGRMDRDATGSRLFADMPCEDRMRLWPILHRERISQRSYLERTGSQPAMVYFIETGVISVLETGDLREPLEVGLIGHEGMTGGSIIIGDMKALRECYVQVAGYALVLSRTDLKHNLASSATLLPYLLRYLQTQMTQISLSASANARGTLQQRLARKLLMYHDRVGADDLPLTHASMSIMLGVRRASVTLAIHNLEGEGWIAAQRGCVTIRDRAGLERYCGPFYGVAERRYREIMGEAVEAARPAGAPRLPDPAAGTSLSNNSAGQRGTA